MLLPLSCFACLPNPFNRNRYDFSQQGLLIYGNHEKFFRKSVQDVYFLYKKEALSRSHRSMAQHQGVCDLNNKNRQF